MTKNKNTTNQAAPIKHFSKNNNTVIDKKAVANLWAETFS